jgi:hypothetical protein
LSPSRALAAEYLVVKCPDRRDHHRQLAIADILFGVTGESFGIALDAERHVIQISACSCGATIPRCSTCSGAPSGRPSIAGPSAIPQSSAMTRRTLI